MPHILDLSGSNEALFHLRHLALGSREYCKREQLHFGDDDYTPEEWNAYQSQLTFLVSRALIGSAITLRVFQDTLRSAQGAETLAEAEEHYGLSTGHNLGQVEEGAFDLDLRESCNKIIHATELALLFRESRTGTPSKWYSYWFGHVCITGAQGKRAWRVILDVAGWCDAVESYIECFAEDLEWR